MPAAMIPMIDARLVGGPCDGDTVRVRRGTVALCLPIREVDGSAEVHHLYQLTARGVFAWKGRADLLPADGAGLADLRQPQPVFDPFK